VHASSIFDTTSFVSLEVETKRFGIPSSFLGKLFFSSENREINNWNSFFDTIFFLGKHWKWTISIDCRSGLKRGKMEEKVNGAGKRCNRFCCDSSVIDFDVIQDNFCNFSTQGIVGSNYLLICMVLEMFRNSLLKDCDLLNIFSFKLFEKIYIK